MTVESIKRLFFFNSHVQNQGVRPRTKIHQITHCQIPIIVQINESESNVPQRRLNNKAAPFLKKDSLIHATSFDTSQMTIRVATIAPNQLGTSVNQLSALSSVYQPSKSRIRRIDTFAFSECRRRRLRLLLLMLKL